jgi:hypothetical protein
MSRTPLIKYIRSNRNLPSYGRGAPIGVIVSDGQGRVGMSICHPNDTKTKVERVDDVLPDGRKYKRIVRVANGFNKRDAVARALASIETPDNIVIPDRRDVGGRRAIKAELHLMLARSYRYYPDRHR